jgi:hypothetical protein
MLILKENALYGTIRVWNDPKLPGDNGEVPILNGVVGGLILRCEIFSLLDKKNKLAR